MRESKRKRETKKSATTGREQTRLRKLLDELHEDQVKTRYKNSNSAKRAEAILDLIRSRQVEQERKEAIEHWISFVEYIEKRASAKAIEFLNKVIRK